MSRLYKILVKTMVICSSVLFFNAYAQGYAQQGCLKSGEWITVYCSYRCATGEFNNEVRDCNVSWTGGQYVWLIGDKGGKYQTYSNSCSEQYTPIYNLNGDRVANAMKGYCEYQT